MNIILIIYIITTFTQAQIATLSCSTYTNQADCKSQGYCAWYNGACQNQECYLVDEAAACRTQGAFVGALVGVCQQLNVFSVDQDNLCMELTETGVQWPFMRWKFNYKGTATQTSTGKTVSQLKTTTSQNQYLQQLLTLNINQASKSELKDILDAYLNFIPQLYTVHPYFIEKAIIHSIQKIRVQIYDIYQDDNTIDINEQQQMLIKVWMLTDIWKQRLRSYKPTYLANYNFVVFLQNPLQSKSLSVTSNYQTITVTWSSYSDNGYISMIFTRLKSFGLKAGLTAMITLDVALNTGYMLSSPLVAVLKWQWYGAYAPSATGQVFLFSVDRVTFARYKLATPVTCNVASLYCQTDPMTLSSQGSYQFSEDLPEVCTGKTFTYCRLSGCTWSGASCS